MTRFLARFRRPVRGAILGLVFGLLGWSASGLIGALVTATRHRHRRRGVVTLDRRADQEGRRMRPVNRTALPHIAFATLLAVLARVALADIDGRSAPPVADGAPPAGPAIEAAPVGLATPGATVLGELVDTTDPEAARDTILTRLFDRYAAERGIRAEPAEVDAMLETMRRAMAASGLAAADHPKPEEKAEVDAMRRDLVHALILRWKINKALHAEYGGRIIHQQLGPEPLDAYRRFLRQREAEGAFAILDQALARSFGRYFTDDSIHEFMAPGSADEARAFAVPPREQAP